MARLPAVIIIARHGARLDAADPQWHLTSPTPYDPPLTYGGWKQSQALGARIASILKFREDASSHKERGDTAGGHDGLNAQHQLRKSKRRRHRVMIHSSPFLRCVQTSIGIGAGIEYWDGVLDAEASRKNHKLHSGSPHVHASDNRTSPTLSAIPEPEEVDLKKQSLMSNSKAKSDRATLATLRLDAFLGEWLSPDYFDNITPPPGSKMMIAGAKADLLRRSDPIEGHHHPLKIEEASFPGGWNRGSEGEKGTHKPSADSLDDLSGLESALPRLARANTHTAFGLTGKANRHLTSRTDQGDTQTHVGYTPPKPPYAVSTVQPIPQGYVAHARNACVKVDYQWDSMRPPLKWGSGGDYGEEWSTMHKRFRKGFHDLMLWYGNHQPSQEPEDSAVDMERLHHTKSSPLGPDEGGEEDTVLIIVTHGAGCNALIGALTNQPVLIDVGLCSLTMAARKPGESKSLANLDRGSSPPRLQRRFSFMPGLSEDYDIKLTASTDHLRQGSQFLGSPVSRSRSPSMPMRDKSPYRYERHVGSPTRQHAKSNPVKALLEPKSARHSEGSFEEDRSPTAVRQATVTATPTQGLWSKPAARDGNAISPVNAVKVPVPRPKEEPQSTARIVDPHPNSNDVAKTGQADVRTSTSNGLWTASKSNGSDRSPRTPKRRWTASQV